MVEILRTRHYSRRTEQAYVHWIRHFVLFHAITQIFRTEEATVRYYKRVVRPALQNPMPNAGRMKNVESVEHRELER